MADSDLFIDIVAPNGQSYKQPRGLFINNEFVRSSEGKTIASIDPGWVLISIVHFASTNVTCRTDTEIASVYADSAEDIDIAVKAAQKALKDPSWKLLPGTDRGRLMSRLADLIEEKKELFATIDAWDNGRWAVYISLKQVVLL